MAFVRQLGFSNLSRKDKIKGGIMVAVGLVISTGDTFLNTVFLRWWRKLHTLRSENKLVRLPTKLELMADTVLQEMRIKSSRKLLTQFFCAKGLDIIGLGNGYLRYGMSIGIPYSFNYGSADEIDPDVIASLLDNEMVRSDWYTTEPGRKLIEALSLSDAAKKFAIGCEMNYLDSPETFVKTLLVAGFYALTIMGSSRFQGMAQSSAGLMGQIVLTVMLGLVAVALYSILSEFVEDILRDRADKRTIQNRKEDYRKGAVEYYEKLIERNKQLRRLLKNGHAKYDIDGEKLTWYGYSFSSLHSRLSSVKQLVEKVNSQPKPYI